MGELRREPYCILAGGPEISKSGINNAANGLTAGFVPFKPLMGS